jgi:histidinol-phosphate aminotransferase
MAALHPTITPQPGLLDIAPYVGGESGIPGANRVIKLSSNENPFGPSPRAVEAYRAEADRLALYPDGGHARLRNAIAQVHGLGAEQIVCGNGSDELIGLLCAAYAGPGDEVLYSEHGFLMYPISARVHGATPVKARERDRTTDVDALLAACTDRTRLVFIANPNNPTGTMIPRAEVARLAEGLPPKALLVLDAAYAEYVTDAAYDPGPGLIEGRENVVMTRTFSKIHGLAALRVGWAYGPAHVIDVLNRARGPFNLNAPALAAAEAAMGDQAYVAHCQVQNEVWRDWLAKRLERAGLAVTPSAANFLLADFPDAAAARADAFLKSRGLIVRRVEGYGLPNSLRITIGDEDACRAVAEAVAAFMENGP